MFYVTYQGVPLEFIHPKSKGALRDIYRFNLKNPKEFKTVPEAQAYLNSKFQEQFKLAQDYNFDLDLWRRIKAIHWHLEIVDSERKLVGRFPTPKIGAVAQPRRRRGSGPARVRGGR